MKNNTKKKGWMSLLGSQFLGAFNDNAWKLIVFTLATRASGFLLAGKPCGQWLGQPQLKASLSFLVFLLPMLLFSFFAGALADRYSKRRIIILTKALELGLMLSATVSLFIAPTDLLFPLLILAGMGVHSALFSPAKYGVITELLPETRLASGNAWMEGSTMVAIIAGTGLGPILLSLDLGGVRAHLSFLAPLILSIFACIGFFCSLRMPSLEPARKEPLSIYQSNREAWKLIVKERSLFFSVAGLVFFWFIISLLGQNIMVYAEALVKQFQLGEFWMGIPPACFGLGIALGAVLSSRVSSKGIELGWIPLGAIVFACTSLLLSLLESQLLLSSIVLVFMGASSGLVLVPLNALSQKEAPAKSRGSILSLINIFTILAMLLGSLCSLLIGWVSPSIQVCLLASSCFVILGTLWAVWHLPSSLVRLLLLLLTKGLYKCKILGKKNIPTEGAALIVANHLSLIDAFLLMACTPRPIHFLMKSSQYKKWWIQPFARAMKVIPVEATASPKALLTSLKEAGKRLDAGELVCIFPEGQTSHTGMLQSFQKGVEFILKSRDVPVLPVHLDRVWGSIFSYSGGRFFRKLPKRIPYPVTVNIGAPLASSIGVMELRRQVLLLGTEAWQERKAEAMCLHRYFVRSVRRAPFALALAESGGRKMSRVKTLAVAVDVARQLRAAWHNQTTVAVMLPQSREGVIANVAAALAGKEVVNVNFTTGQVQFTSALRQSKVRTLLTSRSFFESISLDCPEGIEILCIEDLLEQPSFARKIFTYFVSLFLPISFLESLCGSQGRATCDSNLTTLFTSGSSGEPKGVILSHFNLFASIEGVAQVLPPIQHRLLHSLPLFHSYGYMALWLGLKKGMPLILHPNMRDMTSLGALIQEYSVTQIFTTPTFLRFYMRRVLPSQMSTVRCVLTGAEKLPEGLQADFETRFGLRPIEGYGVTECAPVIATSTLSVKEVGIFQVGAKRGSVGRPLPGVSVRIVDPETREDVQGQASGLLLVKGPNVMQGYLNREDLTASVLQGGWYNTGDIAYLDEDGFLFITDRLSRFSKIGGEMVPHGKVEAALLASGKGDYAVTSLADPRKGESLFVLYTNKEGDLGELLQALLSLGLPRLFLPRKENFLWVESIPLLGSGKVDLQAVRRIAEESVATRC
jgi:acyl-[acyl-carrier-protein]-phospholipid O-acyltransferase/long-chain-fatty-acid--[acyl-carrier-protein] ligase